MKYTKITIKLLILSLFLGTTGLDAYGFLGFGGSMDWKEEVLLHDGSKIIVERSLTRGGRHEIGQRPPAKEQSLSFSMPGTGQNIIWEDKFSEDIGSSNFNLMMLETLDNTAYLLGSPMGCLSYNKWGRPNPPYVIFKYQSKEWKRITMQELPPEFKMPNLVISSPDDRTKQTGLNPVPVEKVQELNKGFKQPEYKTILREPLTSTGARCGEMVYDGNGGWIGIGWFRDQSTYMDCLKQCEHKKLDRQHCPCETLFKGNK